MHPLISTARRLAQGCAAAVLTVTAWAQGEKIEFSPPTEPTPMRPLTGADIDANRLNLTRRSPGSGAASTDASLSMTLPPPDQVNRYRALKEMLDRRSAWARPDSIATDGDDAGMAMYTKGAGPDLTIDDLFERNRDSRRSGETAREFTRREREDSRSGSQENGGRGGSETDYSNARAANGGETPRPGDRGLRGDGPRGASRVMDLNPGAPPGFESMELSNNFMGLSGLDGVTSSSRDSDRLQARDDRRAAFQELLGGARTPGGFASPDRVGSPLGFTTTTRPGSAPGATPGPRNLSEALAGRGGTPGANAEGPGSDTRLLGQPVRPSGLDLRIGAEAEKPSVNRAEAPPAPVRPMELFRQKHDARIPTRSF